MTIKLDLLTAAALMGGTALGENLESVAFLGVSTDSRKIASGELFFALVGENFDGHDFVALVRERQASAAVVAAAQAERCKDLGLPLVVVADTRLALGALASGWRSRHDLPLIAVTGSNGKTTTKEMLASIMRAAFGSAADALLATQGNLNNDVGLPLTLFQLGAAHKAAVIEMGMNHPGEIAYLARIAKPTVALVTNAQRAHLEGMGTIESIASEKGSVFSCLPPAGVAVFNADDPWAGLWRAQSALCQVMSHSFAGRAEAAVHGSCALHGLENRLTIRAAGEQIEIALALPGAHNARNALAAATAALAAGIPLATVGAGLAAFRGIKGRLQRRDGINGAVVLDDTYNANPDSVRAGIDVLAATIGKKLLVLGDIGEIGEMTGQFHDEVGGYAKSQGIDRLFAFGESSAIAAYNFGGGATHFKKIDELIDAVRGEMTPETIVLVKGSRFMRMERVSDAITIASAGEKS